MFLEGRSARRADEHSSWTVLSQHVAQTGSCPLAWWWWWWCHSSGGGRSAGDSVGAGDDDGDGAGGTAAPPFLSLTSAPLPCPQILGHFDIAFTSVFTVEIVLKVSGGRGTAWPWGTSRPGAQTGGGSSLPAALAPGPHQRRGESGRKAGRLGAQDTSWGSRSQAGRAAVEPGRAAACSPAPPARRSHVCAARRFLLPVEGSVCPGSPREQSSFPRPSLP